MFNTELVSFINAIVPIILGFILLWVLTPCWRYSPPQILLFTLIVLLFSLFINVLIYSYFAIYGIGKTIACIFNMLLFIIFYATLTHSQNGKNLFTLCSGFSFILCLSCLGDIIGKESSFFRMFIKITGFGLILLLVHRYFKAPFFFITQEYRGVWYRLLLIPVTISLFAITLLLPGTLYYDPQLKLLAVILCLLTVCLYTSLYHVLSSYKTYSEDEGNFALLKEQIYSFQQQLQTADEANEKLHIFRHDMRHYIHILNAALDSRNLDAAKDILESMGNTLSITERNPLPNYTDNLILDSVLTHYAAFAKEHHALLDFYTESNWFKIQLIF